MREAVLDKAREALASPELAERCRGVELLAGCPAEEATEQLVALLGERSWYLRERVVEALERRPSALAPLLRILKQGSWFARASACDALGRRGEPDAIASVVEQVEDRNVSIQKSAVLALRRLGGHPGEPGIAGTIARLPARRRRRILARIRHQSPEWGGELAHTLAGLPEVAFAEEPRGSASEPPAEEVSVVRFREWLAALAGPGRGRP